MLKLVQVWLDPRCPKIDISHQVYIVRNVSDDAHYYRIGKLKYVRLLSSTHLLNSAIIIFGMCKRSSGNS